ncbi:MAG: hypothetical protein GWN58_33060 [Anaerolineae bacterium]|nr:hypothetical protein [Thermoplasmata archaeon]NIV34105.1 hypothetical protein [Anaerolineae bacterium]NIY05956.1 hypothetical protein [Thermoplasmata archaeon]
MRYLQSGGFSAQVGDRQAQKNYRDNWEKTFGKKQAKPKPKKAEVKTDEAVAAR